MSLKKIFITKYALTSGIIEKEAEINSEGLARAESRPIPEYYHLGEYELTREAANKKAEALRLKKIRSLEKTILKMKELKF